MTFGGRYQLAGRIAIGGMGEVGQATVDVSGVRREVNVALVDEPARPIEIGDYQADDRRFREATGWRARVGLEAGLTRTLDHYRRHLDRYR